MKPFYSFNTLPFPDLSPNGGRDALVSYAGQLCGGVPVRGKLLFLLASLLIFASRSAGQAVACTEAVGQSRAVVNFSELARQQAFVPRGGGHRR
jgi:hypothetical protein